MSAWWLAALENGWQDATAGKRRRPLTRRGSHTSHYSHYVSSLHCNIFTVRGQLTTRVYRRFRRAAMPARSDGTATLWPRGAYWRERLVEADPDPALVAKLAAFGQQLPSRADRRYTAGEIVLSSSAASVLVMKGARRRAAAGGICAEDCAGGSAPPGLVPISVGRRCVRGARDRWRRRAPPCNGPPPLR